MVRRAYQVVHVAPDRGARISIAPSGRQQRERRAPRDGGTRSLDDDASPAAMHTRLPRWVMGCRSNYVSSTSGVPEIADDLLHRASRPAKRLCAPASNFE